MTLAKSALPKGKELGYLGESECNKCIDKMEGN